MLLLIGIRVVMARKLLYSFILHVGQCNNTLFYLELSIPRKGVVHRAVLLAPGTPWCLGKRPQGDYTIQAAADRWLSWKDDCRQIQTRPATRACYFIIRLVLAGFTLRQGVVHRAVLLALGTPWCLGKRAQGDYTIQAAADG